VRTPSLQTATLAALACAAATLAARSPQTTASATQPPIADNKLFQSGIEITSITATVTDKEGRLIHDLPREAFEIYEDGVRQTVTQFTRDRVPIGLGVLLDISDSMYGARIQDARTAVDRFLFDLLDPADEFFLLAFNHTPHPLTRWTRTQEDVRRALAGLRPTGGTAIYDAIAESLSLVAHRSRQRAALLVIPQALREITNESGGRTEVVQTSAEITDATARIAEELNSQYLLGFTSPKGADGQYHSLRVRVPQAEYRVRARNGYVATKR